MTLCEYWHIIWEHLVVNTGTRDAKQPIQRHPAWGSLQRTCLPPLAASTSWKETSRNVGIAMINHPCLMVYTTHVWWLGGWFIIAIPTLIALQATSELWTSMECMATARCFKLSHNGTCFSGMNCGLPSATMINGLHKRPSSEATKMACQPAYQAGREVKRALRICGKDIWAFWDILRDQWQTADRHQGSEVCCLHPFFPYFPSTIFTILYWPITVNLLNKQ